MESDLPPKFRGKERLRQRGSNSNKTSSICQSSSDGKESACNAGDLGLILGSGRSPGEENGNPLQRSCLEKSHGQRSLVGYSPWGHKELDMTKWLTLYARNWAALHFSEPWILANTWWIGCLHFLIYFLVLVGRWLCYNIVVVSAMKQHESATGTHMSPPSWSPLPPPTPSHPSRLSHSTGFELPASYSKSPLVIYFTYGDVYVPMLLSICPSLSSPHCVHKSRAYYSGWSKS